MSTEGATVKEKRKRDGFYHLNGEKYIAVTTVLEVLAKPALIHWAARTAAGLVLNDPDTFDTSDKAAGGIYAARDRAADRGALVHSLIEAFARQSQVEIVVETAKGYADAFWSWVAQTQPTPLYSEANVYSTRHKYAGTTDMIAAFPDKQLRLLDFKTGKNIYPEVGLQMAAYRNCDFILPHVGNNGPIPMPPVAETAVVLLHEDGTFQYKTLKGDFEVFLHLKAVSEWQRSLR